LSRTDEQYEGNNSVASALRTISNAFDAGERRRLGGLFGIIALMHIVGWGVMLLYVAPRYPSMVALGGLAYTFGLRHAFDADHISAIDNTTRKMLQQGKKPMGVGFFFSLGHSTVVFIISLLLGLATKVVIESVQSEDSPLKNIGGIIGTTVSGLFLLLIGILNLIVFLEIYRVYRGMRAGTLDRHAIEHELVAGGIMSKVFGRFFRLISESWHMYPLGFLFGLGFDTATEVALLAISAGAAAQGLPLLAVLCLPLIFASGMSLMDTADGAFMCKAYAWAFSNPIRKVYYNLTVTGLSVFVALFVGAVELLQLLSDKLGWNGGAWTIIRDIDFNVMGFVIVGTFILTWVVAFAVWKVRRIEDRWGVMVGPE